MISGTDGSVTDWLRALPQVDAVLSAGEGSGEFAPFQRKVVKRLVQHELALLRTAIQQGRAGQPPDAHSLAQAVAQRAWQLVAPQLRPAINASGIVLHTNLGRAVLSQRAQAALQAVAGAYCNLELDLATGQRSRRDAHLEPLLQALTGCEAATVVNNNAAAVYLALHTLAAGREVITSRGELIEIGGSFRIPDIMRTAGCTLVEVGTTNRTRLDDYAAAFTPETAMLLKTHPSNYRVRGFCEETALSELCTLGAQHGCLVYYDVGSGYFAQPGQPALPEPDVLSALETGAGLVSFSGDKLLGGPQAGILIGKRNLIAKLRQNPLWRVLRIDKFTAAALEATLAERVLKHATADTGVPRGLPAADELQGVARQLADGIKLVQPRWEVAPSDGVGYYGGGSLPDESIPSAVVCIRHPSLEPAALDGLARAGHPPVVGYVQHGSYTLNVLALLPGDIQRITQCLGGLPRE
jgi:L-seryl-tRNA(Ser) seleniumtransferase